MVSPPLRAAGIGHPVEQWPAAKATTPLSEVSVGSQLERRTTILSTGGGNPRARTSLGSSSSLLVMLGSISGHCTRHESCPTEPSVGADRGPLRRRDRR